MPGIIEGLSPGYGFIAVIIAPLGRENALGVCLVAFFFAVLLQGSEVMYRTLGIPVAFAQTLQDLVLVFVLIGEVFTRIHLSKRIKRRWEAAWLGRRKEGDWSELTNW